MVRATQLTPLDGSASRYEIDGRLQDFALNFAGAISLAFTSFSFRAQGGKKLDISAEGMALTFEGPLRFVDTLRHILPESGFSDPPALEVSATGIRAGYTLGVPSVGVGVFSLQNLSISAGLSLPFVDQPAGVRFALSERHKPFLVSVALFGGGGFFALGLNARGIEQVEAAIEFGGNISLNLGIASGGVYVMAGIYFCMTGTEVKLTGYLRCGGYLSVLGLISLSIEFYLGFTYRKKGEKGGEAWGQASVKVCVKIAFFSVSVTLSIERRFAGAAGDPTFAELVGARGLGRVLRGLRLTHADHPDPPVDRAPEWRRGPGPIAALGVRHAAPAHRRGQHARPVPGLHGLGDTHAARPGDVHAAH